MIEIDDYSPIRVGDTGTPLSPRFLHKDESPVNLTGATMNMKMKLTGLSGTDPIPLPIGTIITCSNTDPNAWIIDDTIGGRAHRQWSVSDVAVPGIWDLYIVITKNGLPVHADMLPLIILAAP